MGQDLPIRIASCNRPSGVALSAVTTALVAVMPKCPLCWMALTSALGVGSTINSSWARPLAVALLFLSTGLLFVRARRRGGHGPFYMALAAACAVYLSKFHLGYEAGVYLGGAALVGASVWGAAPRRRQPAPDLRCQCRTAERGRHSV